MLRGCGRGAAVVLRGAAGSRGTAGQRQQEQQQQQQQQGPGAGRPLEPSLLQFLVCPLSKRPLRYEESTNELINEELGIAYPVVDGIPNMIPEAARSTKKRP